MLKTSVTMLCLSASVAIAEAPKVATDIAPVHSLVAQVMKGVGTPSLIMPSGSSPHHYSMRPSEARDLQTADMVVWIGEDLTPWLERSIESLAKDAVSLELLHLPETKVLDVREGAVFESHDVHHDEHDDHGDDHKDQDDHDEHSEDKDHGHHDHAHEGADPHAWMSPENAQIWLAAIAEQLGKIDPNNAEVYATNAALSAQVLQNQSVEWAAQLESVKAKPFIVFHDAYQYFETSMDLNAAGALQLSDASSPSAARLKHIQDEIIEHKITCVFAEPQFNPNLIKAVTSDATIKSGTLDPLGVGIEPGADFYTSWMSSLVKATHDCLN